MAKMLDRRKAVVRISIKEEQLGQKDIKEYIKEISNPIIENVKQKTGEKLLVTCHINGEVFGIGYEDLNGIEITFETIYYPYSYASEEAWEKAVLKFWTEISYIERIGPVHLEMTHIKYKAVI